MNRDIKSIIWILLCAAVFCTPFALLLVTGEAPHDLEGEKDYARPGFTVGGFFSGAFQTDFEHWFSTKYPLRPQVVEIFGALDAGKDMIRFLDDAGGFRGSANVVVGKDGYLYENGYINEYFGYAPKYAEVTDAWLSGRAALLKEIQERLTEQGIAFCLVITPSKAGALPEFIPEWYKARYTAPEGYVRPYTRFVSELAQNGVFYIDSAELYRALGLRSLFPKTSTHWSKTAAFETTAAVIAEYARQTGTDIKRLAYNTVLQGTEPPGFGNSETDIFGIVYAGKSGELEQAVRDTAYYWPDVYTVGADKPDMGRVWVQGGSFADDIVYYLSEYGAASGVKSIRYNNGNDPSAIDWGAELDGVTLVLLEVNEQFVHNLGGNGPVFGAADFTAHRPGADILEALRDYLSQ
jgi:hypothetical protein